MRDFIDYDDLTWVATLVGAHGIKGAVRAKYFTDTPEYYLKTKLFYLETDGQLRSLKVLQLRPAKNGWIILFEELVSRNDAERLKGCRLLLPDEQLKPLEADEIFIHQLIGCKVEDQNGFFLGKITDFLETGANSVYEVRNGKSRFLVPDVPHVVKKLDVEAQRMVIDPLPGLIEEEAPEDDVTF
ncbi:MAG: 16S rRNA processing protein RimM [SAR324 cluster bacterium]|nr:16S rRNA processing protein RimM [SAR324 cluster bacterium]MBL7035742.1 16S rRNA processing protein RimM [SAR324 cluster bacterium]